MMRKLRIFQYLEPSIGVDHDGQADKRTDTASSKPTVKQLRWDHSNLSLYRDTTGSYLHNIYQDLLQQPLDDSVTPYLIDNFYTKIVGSVRCV